MSNQLEQELVSGGFCWEPKRVTGRPFTVVGMKRRNCKRRKKPDRRAYMRAYALEQRRYWLKIGVAQPKDDAERKWLETNK